jgi:hypothetical protein
MSQLDQREGLKFGEDDETCGPGNHKEKISYPSVPDDEQSPQGRIARMRETPNANAFEIAAAEHDVRAGDITHGEQLSRDRTQEEIDQEVNGHAQHILAICQVCRHAREIDQAPDKNNTVEAKNIGSSPAGSNQFLNNEKFIEGGGKSVNYKLPRSTVGQQAAEAARGQQTWVQTIENTGFGVIPVRFP